MPHAGKAFELIFPFEMEIRHDFCAVQPYLTDRCQNAPAFFAVLTLLQLDQLMVDGHSRREGGIILMTPDRQVILCLDRRVVPIRCFLHELHAMQQRKYSVIRRFASVIGNKRALRVLHGARCFSLILLHHCGRDGGQICPVRCLLQRYAQIIVLQRERPILKFHCLYLAAILSRPPDIARICHGLQWKSAKDQTKCQDDCDKFFHLYIPPSSLPASFPAHIRKSPLYYIRYRNTKKLAAK